MSRHPQHILRPPGWTDDQITNLPWKPTPSRLYLISVIVTVIFASRVNLIGTVYLWKLSFYSSLCHSQIKVLSFLFPRIYIYIYIYNRYIESIILLVWKKKPDCTICKSYKLISGKKFVKRRKDEKHTYYLKIVKQHVCQVKRKNHRKNYQS